MTLTEILKSREFNARRSLDRFLWLESGPQFDAEWNALTDWQRDAIDTLWQEDEHQAANRAQLGAYLNTEPPSRDAAW